MDWKVIGVKGIVGVYGVCIGWSGKWRSEVDGVWSELSVEWMECEMCGLDGVWSGRSGWCVKWSGWSVLL